MPFRRTRTRMAPHGRRLLRSCSPGSSTSAFRSISKITNHAPRRCSGRPEHPSKGGGTEARRSVFQLTCLGAFVALVSALIACKQTAAPQQVHSPVSNQTVTFNEHVAPILFEHCVSCHRPIDSEAPARAANDPKDPLCVGGAPFSLLDYSNAKAHASQIA